jgi:hypothetical protein
LAEEPPELCRKCAKPVLLRPDRRCRFCDAAKGFTSLLWLASDHVHIYIESDGELSVEAMIKEIKAFSRKSFLEKYPDLMEKNGERPAIWDDAYFSETIG